MFSDCLRRIRYRRLSRFAAPVLELEFVRCLNPIPAPNQIEELCRALKGNTVTKVILVHGWDLTDEAFKLIVELIETLPNCLGLNAGENDEVHGPLFETLLFIF